MARALVLGGGGARGSFQVGMLLELVGTKGLDFTILRGVSVGALNAAFLAQAPVGSNAQESIANLRVQVGKLHDLWTREIKGNHSVYAERPGGFAGLVAGADSLFSVKPLRALIKKHLSLEALRASGRDFAVGTVSLVSGTYEEWTPADDDFVEKVVASTAIPVVFPLVRVRKDVLVDGGVRNITPLSSAFKAKPDELYVLLTSRVIRQPNGDFPDSAVQPHDPKRWDENWLGTAVSGLDVLKRTLDILTDEIYLDDIRGALDWNRVAAAVDALTAAASTATIPASVRKASTALRDALKEVHKRHVPIHVLAPTIWFGADNSSTEFDPERIKVAVEHGKEVAGRNDDL
jgi:NTE family protein